MESVFLTSSSTYESKIKDLLNRNKTTPERVVRLALRLLLHKKTPGCAALERFSEMILKLVLTETDRSDEGNVQNDEGLCASRAANCVLVHLGAIKRERNASSSSEVDSDEDPIKSPNKTIEHPGSVLAVIQRIIDSHGTSMPAVVARSLSIMLMECRDKLKSDIERDEERPSNENILDRLVESLELQLNQINIHEKQ
ncbi:unnamed protein product [Protopolystoma xenopodis]|uniref:Uncharacterized protein n=1 Tax=Protopolystoma xenopodis TaxID=117903 RepID=A0A448X5L4_9PLAT|nr:unnamed protein product [Protopolystoma xenopodis]